MNDVALRPIILGGDIGAYATARAFHEGRGASSVVVATARVWPVRDSAIIDLRVIPTLAEGATLTETIRSIAAEQPTSQHLVIATADWLVEHLAESADAILQLVDNVTIPYPGADVVARVANKAEVMQKCAELGIPHPATTLVELTEPDVPDLPQLDYPQVVKVASTTAAHSVSYPGEAKVHVVANEAEARDLLLRMARAGLRGSVLLQERLPGGDSAMAAANLFVGRDHRVRFAQFGRVLLEEHTPTALGNSVAQVTVDSAAEPEVAVLLQHMRSLVESFEWSGFANIDLMRGADGVYRVLEINPRVGRSGYAVTASGYNVADMYTREFVTGETGPSVVATARHLFAVVPLLVLRRFAPQQWREVRNLVRSRSVTNPLYYSRERNPRRWWYIGVAMINQIRKFARYYPRSARERD